MLSFQYNDNKYYKNNQTKNEEKPASDQNKVRADIFSGSLAVCLFASASRRGGRKGGLVFALPPAEPVYEIGSDIFKYTPQFYFLGGVRKWLNRPHLKCGRAEMSLVSSNLTPSAI